jgi:hypothetical protein
MPEVLNRASSAWAFWIPAFAGMTNNVVLLVNSLVSASCNLGMFFIDFKYKDEAVSDSMLKREEKYEEICLDFTRSAFCNWTCI